MASPTRWTWVWVNSWSWWWTGRSGVLRFMGSQRVRHDCVTKLNWTEWQFNIRHQFFRLSHIKFLILEVKIYFHIFNFMQFSLMSRYCVVGISQFSTVTQSCPTLWPQGLKLTRLPCQWPTPRACSNSCPLSQWFHPSILSFVISFSSYLPFFLASEFFSNESDLHIRWPKYWSSRFSISPCNDYSELISFKIDWFDLLAVQETLKILLHYHNSKATVFPCSAILWSNSQSIHD